MQVREGCNKRTGPGGFTLAELLMALLILGVIATFTIPKVLTAQTDTRYKAMAKEVMGMVSAAYDAYKSQNTVTTSFHGGHLTPYMNYVSVETAITVDDNPTDSNGLSCASNQWTCLQLHNGGVLLYPDVAAHSLGGTATTSGIWFHFDPDGKNLNQSAADGPGKSLEFWLYYNGGIRNVKDMLNNTCNNMSCYNPASNKDPSWFNWN